MNASGRFVLAGIVGLLSGCASAPRPESPAPVPTPSGGAVPAPAATPAVAVTRPSLFARIPTEVAGYKLTERAQVANIPGDSLFRFSNGSRTVLTVFVYGVSDDLKAEPDSQKWTAREGDKFRQVQEIRHRRGDFVDYNVAFADTTRFEAGRRSILEHRIATAIKAANGAIAIDMQHLYLIDGRFLKVRATIPESGWQQNSALGFGRELAMKVLQAK